MQDLHSFGKTLVSLPRTTLPFIARYKFQLKFSAQGALIKHKGKFSNKSFLQLSFIRAANSFFNSGKETILFLQ